MAAQQDVVHTKHRSASCHREPEVGPYSGVSSFKHFDNTIISGYEAGPNSRLSVRTNLVKSRSISDISIDSSTKFKEHYSQLPVRSRVQASNVGDTEACAINEQFYHGNSRYNRQDGLARIKRSPVSVATSFPNYLKDTHAENVPTSNDDVDNKPSENDIRNELSADNPILDLKTSSELQSQSATNGRYYHNECSGSVLHKPPIQDFRHSKQLSHGHEHLKASRRKLPTVPKSRLGVPRVAMETTHSIDVAKEMNEEDSKVVVVKKEPDKYANGEVDSDKCEDDKTVLKEKDYLRKINHKLETQYVLKMTSLEGQSDQSTNSEHINKSERVSSNNVCNSKTDPHLANQDAHDSVITDSVPESHHLLNDKDAEKVNNLSQFSEGKESPENNDRESNPECSVRESSGPDIFRFDNVIIQELTDAVMEKQKDDATRGLEHSDQDNLNSSTDSETRRQMIEQSLKLALEGVSSRGATNNCGDSKESIELKADVKAKYSDLVNHIREREDGDIGSDKSPLPNDDMHFDKNSERENVPLVRNDSKTPRKQTEGIVRTPSYRRTVMARAKSRYSKKSNMLKECSCVRNEKGEIDECRFCKYMNRRSQTSLGNETTYDFNVECSTDKEHIDICSSNRAHTPTGLPPRAVIVHSDPDPKSPRSIRRVQVSSRVELLMSSALFKKHLHKHENLLNKHTKSYRQFGMQKSVSNLDLSEGYNNQVEQDNSTCESDTTPDIEVNENLNLSMSYDGVSFAKYRPRRYSLTGESDRSIEELAMNENARSERKRKQIYGTIPKSQSQPRTRPPIPFLNSPASRNTSLIPSFREFKQQKGIPLEPETQEEPAQQKVAQKHYSHRIRHRRRERKTVSSEEKLEHENNNSENVEIKRTTNTDDTGSPQNTVHGTKPRRQLPLDRHCSVDGSEPTLHRRSKPRLKARTLSRVEADGDLLMVSSESESSQKSPRDTSKPGSKRPRSLISKKSSLIALIQENENNSENNKDAQSKCEVSGTKSVVRSESDSKFEMERGSTTRTDIKGGHSRHSSLTGKGHNSVSFKDVEDSSQCSVRDVGESDTSTSVAGSHSDSIYSEVNTDDRSSQSILFDRGDDLHLPDRLKAGKDECMAPVFRSTSDACEITPEAARKRRERKERPYKSDPFSGTEILPASKRCHLREERAKLRQIQQDGLSSSSKEEILSFLDSVVAGGLEGCDSFPSLEELNEDEEHSDFDTTTDNLRKARKHPSNVSSLSTDSGVIGQEGSRHSQQSSPSNTLRHSQSVSTAGTWMKSGVGSRRSLSASCGDLSKHEFYVCTDCGQSDQFDLHSVLQICPQCYKHRIERKKTVQEIVDTEINYGRDLNILKEEFYLPMMKAGLLNQDQLDSIFLNLDELIHVNKHFISKLKAAVNHSNQHTDEDLQCVQIGGLFLESSTMFLTFENYCVNQGQAPLLLEQLEKDKELLRIFLHVSQNENQHLRRMHLKSFLMVPVQRIMKYPLLLDRLNRTTFDSHPDKDALREAKEKIEDILGNINAKSKTSNLKHRKSERHYSVTEKMEVSRIALETLRWNRKDACDVITSKLQVTQPVDHLWATKRCKNYKFTTVHAVLLTLTKQLSDYEREGHLINNSNNNNNNSINNNKGGSSSSTSSGCSSTSNDSGSINKSINDNINNNNSKRNGTDRVQSAAVVLIREKNGKYQSMREPFMLDKCVVSQDPDYTEVFEILEWNKESCLLKAQSQSETNSWVQNLRQQMKNLGCWRRRRNALPNILLNHLS